MAIAAGFALGMLALIAGADQLVRGSVCLARRLRISAVVIGLTVVAFGTSAPELAVTLQAAANGSPEIAIGNVVGSNIQNLMLVLGLSAMFVTLNVSQRILWFDMPLLLLLSAAISVMALDGFIGQTDGVLLVMTLGVYTWLCIRHDRDSQADVRETSHSTDQSGIVDTPHEAASRKGELLRSGLQILAGLLLLTVGGRLFVEAARQLAIHFGLTELTIGVTVVAFGTSLPEIVTSIMAALRGHRDLAVGNVIGSNLFNILCVLGIASATSPGGLPLSDISVGLDIPLMLAVTVLVYAVCLSGRRVVRGEGLLLLLIFISYVGWLVASNSPDSQLTTPFAVLGAGFVLLLAAFQVHALSRQGWIPVPDGS
jgi:cation:H+ antiporter